jgi:hypothetical protein
MARHVNNAFKLTQYWVFYLEYACIKNYTNCISDYLRIEYDGSVQLFIKPATGRGHGDSNTYLCFSPNINLKVDFFLKILDDYLEIFVH